ncbi:MULTISPECIES: WD40 repeat domain-containing protein [Moorena]|uniref:WD-40 repeat-containing protein n=1 Tax=Moorena producens 3L TaxID=489825 RepID=F4XQD0_9CYAN|nr:MULTISPECIES: WD40 repeat domain-containing protein [Moorena]EGJ33197.1 WD-40 repeat-containing protein [Moorena producens 3L]NEP69808.1 PQQ-binding-like beta-propeller repeat protein [Moorena sp. SIO3A5]NET67784.1 PQQ-binding-like beta-propeller repeat protein [Moorena sp. SIO1G6]OLT64852.1 hypothetical protein BI334_07245 [Moorena producens 3L]
MSNLRSWLGQKSPEEIEHFLGEIPRLWLEGGNLNKLSRLLSNYEFIEAKLNHPEFGIKALIEDYELIDNIDLYHPDYSEQTIQSLKLIQGALRLSTHILTQDPTQLAGQLSGRLLDFDSPDIQRLLQQIPQTETTCLRSLRATLTSPTGPLLSTLSGHGDSVNAVAVTPDGTRVISGSSDHTVKVWDLNTGAEVLTLTGHTSPVNAVAVTPDGTRVISGASDNTIRVWNLATGKEILRFNGHSAPVNAVAVTPDGTRVISGASDNTVKVWNSATGQEILTFNGHSTPIVALVITPDGNKAVSASIVEVYHHIIVWNLETGKEELTREYNGNLVKTVAITSDNHLIYGSDNGAITIWSLESPEMFYLLAPSHNTETREKLHPISRVLSELDPLDPSHNTETREKLYSITLAPDGKSMIAVYSDNFSMVWDLETNQESDQVKFHYQFKGHLEGHTAPIVDIAFTPDGKRFISASKDKTLKVWNLGLEKNNNKVLNDNKYVNDVTITTNGKQVIFSLPYNRVTVYDLEKNTQILNFATDKYPYRFSRIKNRFVEIIDKIFDWWIKALIINLTYSLLSLGITLFLIVKHKFYPRIRLNDNFHLLLFKSPVIIGFLINIFFFVKLLVSLMIGNKKHKNQFQKAPKMYSNFKVDESSQFFGKKEIITLAKIPYKDEIIFINKHLDLFNSCYFFTAWDLKQKNHKFDLRTPSQLRFIALCLLIPIASISLLVFSWKIIFIKLPLSWLSKILIWCGLSLIPLVVSVLALVFYESLTSISITPDGNYVIAGSTNSTIKVWNLQTRKLRFLLKGHRQEITSLAITPDGKYLVSGSKDKTIKIWNLETRKECFTLTGHGDSVNTLAVTPDGNYVVSGSEDNTIKIWDLEKREEIFTFTGHTDSINRIKVTSNGKLVISASSDKTLQVWDFETREVIATFTGESAINCCAVAPDDVTIVAGDEGGNMHFLRLEGVGSRE